jgi:hypothetical protein
MWIPKGRVRQPEWLSVYRIDAYVLQYLSESLSHFKNYPAPYIYTLRLI